MLQTFFFSFFPSKRLTCICAFIDNPLICSCELIWFPELLQSLKDRDDEMTQKKRPMCLMPNEHREYFVQSMPLERMNCVGKRLVNSQLNSAANTNRYQLMIPLSLLSMISLYFWADWWIRQNLKKKNTTKIQPKYNKKKKQTPKTINQKIKNKLN